MEPSGMLEPHEANRMTAPLHQPGPAFSLGGRGPFLAPPGLAAVEPTIMFIIDASSFSLIRYEHTRPVVPRGGTGEQALSSATKVSSCPSLPQIPATLSSIRAGRLSAEKWKAYI